MDIILGIVFLTSLFLMLGSSLILTLDCDNNPTYRARLKFCFVCSTIIMVGCFATMLVRWDDDSEYIKSVETRLKKCMERFPEHQDRCVISVTK